MSQRMSRREMRKAGLLKPRVAAEPATDEKDGGTQQMEAVFTPDEAATGKPDADEPVATDEPVADEPEDAVDEPAEADEDVTPDETPGDEPEVGGEEATGTETLDEADTPADGDRDEPQIEADEPQSEGTQSEDTPTDGSQTPEATESADDGQDPAVTPERTSVFERFSGDDLTTSEDTDPVTGESDEALAGEDRTVAAEAVKPEDATTEQAEAPGDSDDGDFAGALRAKLKSTRPEASASSADTAEDVYDESPSRWKTAVIFLLLIVVGFGVGILLGSLIFSGGSEASATVTAYSDNFAYYLGAL